MRTEGGAMAAAQPLADGYGNVKARFVPFPATEAAGGGWWRQVWQVEHAHGATPELPRLPVPPADDPAFASTGATLIGVLQGGNGRLRVEVLSRQRQLTSEEVGYVSLLMQALQHSIGPLLINGYEDHPILHVTQAPATPQT
jgi:hypothetical protein